MHSHSYRWPSLAVMGLLAVMLAVVALTPLFIALDSSSPTVALLERGDVEPGDELVMQLGDIEREAQPGPTVVVVLVPSTDSHRYIDQPRSGTRWPADESAEPMSQSMWREHQRLPELARWLPPDRLPSVASHHRHSMDRGYERSRPVLAVHHPIDHR